MMRTLHDMPTFRPLDQHRLRAALADIAAHDQDVASALARIGYPEPRVREPGFATLLRIIAAQQLSTKAVAAIWGRLETRLCFMVTAPAFMTLDDKTLREIGFSRQKIRYSRILAEAVTGGTLPVEALATLSDDEVIKLITSLHGFGRWSAEVYLLFALGRVDTFPADDLALQVAAQRLKGRDERPTAKVLRELVAPWQPYRGAGALFLWHYYGAATLDGS